MQVAGLAAHPVEIEEEDEEKGELMFEQEV
jgi:hypothetical protein